MSLPASEPLLQNAFPPYRRASELETDIKTIKGGDEAAALRRLEDSLIRLKTAFKEVKGLAQGAQEAADKCQVQKTEELSASATSKATVFEGQARAVVNGAKSAAQASQNQKQAFGKAKAAEEGVRVAGEKAAESFRFVFCFLSVFLAFFMCRKRFGRCVRGLGRATGKNIGRGEGRGDRSRTNDVVCGHQGSG